MNSTDKYFELHSKAPVRSMRVAQSGVTFIDSNGDSLGNILVNEKILKEASFRIVDRKQLKDNIE